MKNLQAKTKHHQELAKIQEEAGSLMSEINVIGPFYELNALDLELDSSDVEQLSMRFIRGWIPIFETWTAQEEDYLEILETILEEKDN